MCVRERDRQTERGKDRERDRENLPRWVLKTNTPGTMGYNKIEEMQKKGQRLKPKIFHLSTDEAE